MATHHFHQTTHHYVVTTINAIFCRYCRQFLLPNRTSVEGHLSTCTERTPESPDKSALQTALDLVEPMDMSRFRQNLRQPPEGTPPFPFLSHPDTGLQCPDCSSCHDDLAKMKRHHREKHKDLPHDITFEEVLVQKFLYQPPHHNHYLRVWPAKSPVQPDQGLSSLVKTNTVNPVAQDDTVIRVNATTINPTLLRVGFPQHLQGFQFSEIITLQGTITSANSGWMPHFEKLMSRSLRDLDTCRDGPIMIMLGKRSASDDLNSAQKPVNNKTANRYMKQFQKIICCAATLTQPPNSMRSPVTVPDEIATHLQTLLSVQEDTPFPQAARAVISSLHGIFAQKIFQSPFDSVIISALAVLCIHPRGAGQ
jgi:hypothetical protein